jgi:hypothetical protein
MTHRQVTAKWALIGKERGGEIDAGILATSDDDTRFDRFIGPYATGSPSSMTEQGEPEAPPWVTFAPFTLTNGEIVLSVAVRDPSSEVDHTGRAVWPRRFFLCRFAELAAGDASYQTIWQAVKPVNLPTESRAPVQLTVEPQSLENLVETIEYYGFDELALIAATTLQARVAVTSAAHLRRRERLAVIDAVAALLPYGLRADLSTSSCVNNSADHGIRLVFANFSNNQRLLPLQGTGPEPAPGVALDYLEALHRKKKNSGLASVIAHLWGAKGNYSFSHPEQALDVLEQLNFVYDAVEALRDINLRREQLLTILRRPEAEVGSIWNHQDISSEIRDRVIDLLLLDLDDQAAIALDKHWETLAGTVTGFALRRLDVDDTDSAKWLLQMASKISSTAEDELLAYLLIAERLDRGERRRDALAALLVDRPAPPAEGRYPITCDELRAAHGGTGHAHLALRLLIRESSGDAGWVPSRAARWAQWLCRTPPAEGDGGPEWADWSLALACALSGTEVSPFSNIGSLIWRDPGWAVVLRLAWEARHLGVIVNDIWHDLVEIAGHLTSSDDPARQGTALADMLSFDSSGLAEDVIAVLDTVRVLLGRTPSDFLLRTNDQEAFARYEQRLKTAFGLQAAQGHGHSLERGFLDHAVRGATMPDGAIWLMKSWAADTYRARGLARYVREKDRASGLLEYDQLDGAFWTALVEHEARLKRFAYGPILRMVASQTIEQPAKLRRAREHNSVPATELASVMCEAFVSGMSVKDILHVLQHTTSADGKTNLTSLGPRDLDEVLRQFQGLLFYERSGNFENASFEALLEFYQLISGGALGRAFGRNFARRVKKDLRNQIRSRRKAMRALARERFWIRLVRPHGARRGRRGVPDSQVPHRGHGAGGTG